MKKAIYLLLLLLMASCRNDHSSQSIDAFQPQTEQGKKTYFKKDFRLITDKELKDHWFQSDMNFAGFEVGVFKSKRGIEFKQAIYHSEHYFEVEDGKFEGKNYGEFGGGLNFIPSDPKKDTIRILNTNIVYTFRFKNEIYILLGIAHMGDNGGALVKITREDDTFKYDLILELKSAPEAMTIFEDRIIIAGYQNLTVIQNMKTEFTIDNTFWGAALYPNSVVALNEDEIFIGYRGGYASFSLNTRKLAYYKHVSVKPHEDPFVRRY